MSFQTLLQPYKKTVKRKRVISRNWNFYHCVIIVSNTLMCSFKGVLANIFVNVNWRGFFIMANNNLFLLYCLFRWKSGFKIEGTFQLQLILDPPQNTVISKEIYFPHWLHLLFCNIKIRYINSEILILSFLIKQNEMEELKRKRIAVIWWKSRINFTKQGMILLVINNNFINSFKKCIEITG